ncbi:putative non-classical export protein 1 [Rosellinia necatrix]|uniref:Putative non-classical export protein 1 n=1 Tax=Rosellinia necatrix TaxID=77044 RepID=A0A1S8A756_ROSNE|nr:putative non-classical export protein 1 [Rosellinia necatrix]
MAPPTYIISRVADPIFAVAIGLGAAALRVNREEKEKGKTAQQTIASAKRRLSRFAKFGQ